MVRVRASNENAGSPVEHHFLHEKCLPLCAENNFSGQGLPTDKDSHHRPERHAPSSNYMGRHPEVNHFAHDLTLKAVEYVPGQQESIECHVQISNV